MNRQHPLALRTPWYVHERDEKARKGPVSARPAIQMYDTPEFVRQLVKDPRISLRFDAKEDVWSFPVPVGAFRKGTTGRQRFATSRLVYTQMRKLYQPNHDRFYAVTGELFCDEPGLPRPGDLAGVDLRLVVRRERIILDGDTKSARKLALEVAQDLDAKNPPAEQSIPNTDDLDDVLWVEQTEGREFTAHQAALLAAARPRRIVEAWTIDAAGRSRWVPIDQAAQPALVTNEREMPMWRIPQHASQCEAAHSRSLWFGIVPTFSSELDDTGAPMLDDRSIYRIVCFARQQPPPALAGTCPPRLWWSEPTTAYRLASFYDPNGTKNRRVSITMPDFRALSARAGEPQGPGGVEIVRPPGSQLKFDPDKGTPTNASTADFGSDTSRCTFAIELLMIVAMFLFSLFLPVVVFIFQLWWLLLLRFCFPRPGLTLQLLDVHFAAGGTLGDLLPGPTGPAPVPPRPAADLRMLDDDLFEARDATTNLIAADPKLGTERDLGKALVKDLDPKNTETTATRTPEPTPPDPLCPTASRDGISDVVDPVPNGRWSSVTTPPSKSGLT